MPAAFTVAGLVAKNPAGIPHIERLILTVLVIWGFLVLLMLLIRRLGIESRASAYATFLAGVLIVSGAPIPERFGNLMALALVLATTGIAAWLLNRHRSSVVPKVLIYTLAIGLVSGPLVTAYDSITNYGTSSATPTEPIVTGMVTTPDIFLVVADGFPGLQAIEAAQGPEYAAGIASRFRESGFQVPRSVWSSYWSTKFSVPSMLSLGYPTVRPGGDRATAQDMYEMISGDNVIVDWLHSSGYETYMVESGWSGSACGSALDHCVASPWLDESLYIIGAESLFKYLIFDKFGYSFTVGSEATMTWLLDNAGQIAEDGEPSFVFAHIMAPHPPFFLDESCSRVVEEDRSSVTFNRPGVPEAQRDSYLRGQMECVQKFLLALGDLVGEEALVIFLSDHGTDRRHQLMTDHATWSEEAIVERMNVFAAVRSPSDCQIGDGLVIPNILRRAMSCLSVTTIPDVPSVIYLGSETVLSESRTQELLSR